MKTITRLSLFPLGSEINSQNHLVIGGCDTAELAREFGTPLYIFDESTLRQKCAEFKNGFRTYYPDTKVLYASKAFINRAFVKILNEEGLGLDVVSGGEIGIARSADFPAGDVYFHGNNKSAEELALALEWDIGRIIVDNWHELELLTRISAQLGRVPQILLRLSPGVDPHTHRFISTGITDSKFGFPLANGEEVVARALAAPGLSLVGLHFHLGSLIFEVEPYLEAIDAIITLAARLKKKYGFALEQLNIGGGFAIQYVLEQPAPPVSYYAGPIADKVRTKCQELGLPLPQLVIEPGRAIVGQAGVALYCVGAIKDIPEIRRYVSLDGGMADNIRPALYGSRYEAIVANKAGSADSQKVTLAGKFCESGDILIKDIELPPVAAEDLIAIPDCGAYCLMMASNYNASFRPPIVLVKDGSARSIRRRETVDDLIRCDIV